MKVQDEGIRVQKEIDPLFVCMLDHTLGLLAHFQ